MEQITIQATINAPIEKVWQYWNQPEHIIQWNHAGDDWHSSHAENDLRVGGKFKTRMEAKDGSAGFDFEGTYTAVEEHKLISYEMSDGRKVTTTFAQTDHGVEVTTSFDPENENPAEFQKQGWQSILDNFKAYTEQN